MSIIVLIGLILVLVLVLPAVVKSVSKKHSKLVKGLVYLAILLMFIMCLNKYFLKKEGFADMGKPPNPNLIFNTGGPEWGQYVVNPSLIPPKVFFYDSNDNTISGNPFMVGDISITPLVKRDASSYKDENTYYLGNVIAYNGKWYINLAWTDARGPAYSGSFRSSPDRDKNVWKQIDIATLPDKKLVFNYGGPSWGQYTLKYSTIPDSVELNSKIDVGNLSFTTSKAITPYQDANTYYLGDIVSYNGSNYINLAYKDPRGPAYSGSFQSNPDKDKNVWRKLKVCS
jgi:hypothetical protein